jgi:hypothetical protein
MLKSICIVDVNWALRLEARVPARERDEGDETVESSENRPVPSAPFTSPVTFAEASKRGEVDSDGPNDEAGELRNELANDEAIEADASGGKGALTDDASAAGASEWLATDGRDDATETAATLAVTRFQTFASSSCDTITDCSERLPPSMAMANA